MLLRTAHYLFKPFNPLALLRAAGPFGPSLIRRFRPDLRIIYGQPPSIGSEIVVPPPDYDIQDSQSFSDDHIMGSSHFYKDLVPSEDSKFYCLRNQRIPFYLPKLSLSGEIGFKGMCAVAGWAAIPMLPRFANLDPNLPVTFIYGSRSWVDSASGEKAKLLRPNTYVDVKVI
ncbi:unnamed protein product [Protopolystoma xenopodis]|uniref:Uncharacterized protein n=1 Tax=Protopolystoma xenopodis TaxID=117903 RepID=A0A3S5BVQ0_9PLAT|nr:unnamed protein product [Protopolystoma xenopodis]